MNGEGRERVRATGPALTADPASGIPRRCCCSSARSAPRPARDSSTDGADPDLHGLADRRTDDPPGGSFPSGESGITIATKDGKKEKLPLDRLVKLTRDTPAAMAAGESYAGRDAGRRRSADAGHDRLGDRCEPRARDPSCWARWRSRWTASLGLILTGDGPGGRLRVAPESGPARGPLIGGGLADQRRSARWQLPGDG